MPHHPASPQADASHPPLYEIQAYEAFVHGLDHPECVTVDRHGKLWAGGEAGQLYTVDMEACSFEQVGSTGGFVLGICMDGDGALYACDSANHAVMQRDPQGEIATYSQGTAERPMTTPNFALFDDVGNQYVSDSGEWQKNDGRIYRVRPGGETQLVSDAASAFPNGMALSPDGSYLYVILTLDPGVVKLRLHDDGTVGPPESVVGLARTVPDGLAFGADGSLYIACYSPHRVYRLTTEGALDVVVEDWMAVTLAAPTNMVFAGPDRKTLVLANLGRWHLTRGPAPTAGLPLRYPSLARGVADGGSNP